MQNYIIGAGGVGSWLAPALIKLLKGGNHVTLIDGDKLEPKNLDRQLFSANDIGKNKATALSNQLKCHSVAGWFSCMMKQFEPNDILIACVDNHPARSEVLSVCDRSKCRAIIAANETHSAEAYVYLPQWKGTRLDPRVMYPEIEKDKEGDPRANAIGCTGDALKTNPQLATANLMAASFALHLYVVWMIEASRMEPETLPHLPHRLSSTLSRLESFKAITEEAK
jgi:molybdopterin/thiamine biosynthesis adenylyltransferase